MRTTDHRRRGIRPGWVPSRAVAVGRSGRALIAVTLVAVTLAAAGCLGASGGGRVPAGAEVVQVRQMAFRPPVVTVKPGQPVTWRFEDAQVLHDVDSVTGAFESPLRDSGTWTHTFTRSGTYSYFCRVHPYMTGEVVVAG